MIRLRYTSGLRAGQVVGVEGALATIGRAPSCDVIVEDVMVSAVHATLEQVPAGYIVTDQQSSNGTLVNGRRIFRALVRLHDELTLGSTGLKVESSDGFAATLFIPGGPATHVDESLRRSKGPTGAGPLPPRRSVAPAPADAPRPIAELIHPTKGTLRSTPIPFKGLTIGRHPECGMMVDDAQVSGLHCKLVAGPEGVVLTDLGSSNGTFVGDERLQRDLGRLLLGDGEAARVGQPLPACARARDRPRWCPP